MNEGIAPPEDRECGCRMCYSHATSYDFCELCDHHVDFHYRDPTTGEEWCGYQNVGDGLKPLTPDS